MVLNSEFYTEAYKFVFGTVLVFGPLIACIRALQKTLEETRMMYGRPNPYVAMAKSLVVFFFMCVVLIAFYSIVGAVMFGDANRPLEYARQFWSENPWS